jgi:hypothetical protein
MMAGMGKCYEPTRLVLRSRGGYTPVMMAGMGKFYEPTRLVLRSRDGYTPLMMAGMGIGQVLRWAARVDIYSVLLTSSSAQL